jgi:cell division protein FtsB
VTARAIVLLVMVIGLLMAIFAPVRQYLEQRARLAELQRGVAQLEERNTTLKHEIDRFEDPEYIEYLARKCLGMVKTGEIAFVTVPEGGEAAMPDC